MSEHQKDIYSLLLEAEKRKNKLKREEMLRSVGIIEEYFEEGNIKINNPTCRGVECKLCIEACPTSALYRVEGEVKAERDLCIYCSACVLSCIVDNCIVITRRRNGEVERFGTPREAILLLSRTASHKRREVMKKRILAELSSRKYLYVY